MTIRLYHVRHSRSLRPLWLMKEMGLSFELEVLRLDRPYFAGEAWSRINPTGKVPVLFDGETRVFESVAMLEYLTATRGPTPLAAVAGDEDFAEYLSWLHYAEAGMGQYVATYIGHVLGAEDYQVSEAHLTYLSRQIDRMQGMIATQLSDGRVHVLARGFSAADIALGYTLHLARLAKVAFRAEVQGYMDRLDARPAFAEAMAIGKRPS